MPLHHTTIQNVDRFELATILAALRLLQSTPALPEAIEEIATEYGDFERLDDEAIDDLCERINVVAEYPFRDVPDQDDEQSVDDVDEEERAAEAHEMQMRDRSYFAEDS